MSTRKRLSPEESRAAALEAARVLLIEAGPQAVTLKAVAGRVGRTHANLLHHFGSAAGLQKELARHLAQTVCNSIMDAVEATRAGIGSPREVVDLTFDAFGREGGGALASWMLASGNEDALDPIIEAIHKLVHDLHPEETHASGELKMHETTFTIVLLALGDALVGEQLAETLSVKRSVARERAEEILVAGFLSNGVSV
ncbi:TetR/AcrR family transcriptional regulator [Aurantiacibacter aquimixticola]|uniref:TetR/AcrR family transcriptional regulator n=1 Tax=Aurantiacibacter aquimixticola TaxID=1958945 RepID=A0A419RQH5_9SPHN|nr:helix-turn-helix domain-containing protein [Aurantiacibacter aquimixticola]RJY08016.1 TetR/AcrR family transcriptional regulator [Aurantiacibacter aquimixticola]